MELTELGKTDWNASAKDAQMLLKRVSAGEASGEVVAEYRRGAEGGAGIALTLNKSVHAGAPLVSQVHWPLSTGFVHLVTGGYPLHVPSLPRLFDSRARTGRPVRACTSGPPTMHGIH